jgi:hypothetical protein
MVLIFHKIKMVNKKYSEFFLFSEGNSTFVLGSIALPSDSLMTE